MSIGQYDNVMTYEFSHWALRIWNFQGYQRNSMWNFQGLIKNEMKFRKARVTSKSKKIV